MKWLSQWRMQKVLERCIYQIHNQSMMRYLSERVPTIPVNSPSLDVVADSDKGGQYILDLVPTASNGSQTNLGPSQNNEISSFVIRIESNHSTSYIWQVMVDMLTLSILLHCTSLR